MPGQVASLRVEVVFALPERQELRALEVAAGATVGDAIDQSAIADAFPEWNLRDCPAGVWGQEVRRDRMLQDGDRVELYRPLALDPREARRTLAAEGQFMGRGGADSAADDKSGDDGPDWQGD